MKLAVYTQDAKKTAKTVEVSDQVFGRQANPDLLAQYVYVYLSNQRASIAHAKDRSEVSGGGVKPWRQKGTGRARHGSTRSPIWTKGGVTFGPTSDRNWKKTISKQMKKGAIAVALSQLVKEDKLKIVDNIELGDKQLTKQATQILQGFGNPRKITIVAAESTPKLVKAFANLPGAQVKLVSEINAYDIINAGEMLIMEPALSYTENWS